MNLLNYKNRYKPSAFRAVNIYEVDGYIAAIEDLIQYLKEKTEYLPAKRMIDSVELLESIIETNGALKAVISTAKREQQEAFNDLAGIDLGSDKVNSFLKDQIDDLKDIL